MKTRRVLGRVDILDRVFQLSTNFSYESYKQAARFNRLNVILWLSRRGYICPTVCCEAAALGGHLHILQWLVKKDTTLYESEVAQAAIQGGHTNVLEWVFKYRPRQDLVALCCTAASWGRLDMIKWLQLRGNCVTSWTLARAIHHGHRHVVEYLLPICPLDAILTWTAAGVGDLQLLQRLVALNCPVEAYATATAAGNCHLGVLRWLVENDYPLHRLVCVYGRNTPEILEYLNTIQCQCGGEFH
ncbi:MAG: hypothetical protein KGL39_10450 [Patescibacteria group bacterium]|nr:hypothetical protein [Patescibacteria group bacterium]